MLKNTRKSSSNSSPTAEKKIHDESKKEAERAISTIQKHIDKIDKIDKKEKIPQEAGTALVEAMQKESGLRDFSKNKNKSDNLRAIINNNSYNKDIIKNAEKQLLKIKSSEDNNKAKKLIEDAKKKTGQEKNNSSAKFKIILKLADLNKSLDNLITSKFKSSFKKIRLHINKSLHCENEATENIFEEIQTLYTHNVENKASENKNPAVEALCEHFKSSNINLNDFYIFDNLIKIKHEIFYEKNTKVIEYIQRVIKEEEQPEDVINELKEMENLSTEFNKSYQELNSKGIFYTLQAVRNSIDIYRDKCAKGPDNSNPDNNKSLPIGNSNNLIDNLNSIAEPDTGSSTPSRPLTPPTPPLDPAPKDPEFLFML